MKILIFLILLLIQIFPLNAENSSKLCRGSFCYYKEVTQGWTIYYSESVVLSDQVHFELVKNKIENDLVKIKDIFPFQHLYLLQKINVYVNLSDPHGRHPGAVYHPSRQWLGNHGYDPGMAKSIEISNTANYLSWTQHQPAMILHELAHAYHDRFLDQDLGQTIELAFLDAVQSGIYKKVRYYNGKLKKAYAITNNKEYFAEATEAFFWKNDFYPFNNRDLKSHDPRMYKILNDIWN